MKIVRHIAPDMRKALRTIRSQLGEDAVILSSRRVPEGVEVTAAIDFEAGNLQGAMAAAAENLTVAPLPPPAAPTPAPRALAPPSRAQHSSAKGAAAVTRAAAASGHAIVATPAAAAMPAATSAATAAATSSANSAAAAAFAPIQHPAPSYAALADTLATATAIEPASAHIAATHGVAPTYATVPSAGPVQGAMPGVYSHAASSHYFPAPQAPDVRPFAHILDAESVPAAIPALAPAAASALTSTPAVASASIAVSASNQSVTATSAATASKQQAAAEPSGARREPTINIESAARDFAAEMLAELPAAASAGAASEAMGTELKTLRLMLETQLAQLAWNDLSRRAPAHVEILRELTEIGITQDLSDYILKQLPDKVELGFARRFAIAGLSQYLPVTGDRWLENGGRVAFVGATGVGKTTTLAKLAVRWVLRHGSRDLGLVGCDTVRIGAQDQIQSLGQLLGVPVYTPENFESLPTLLTRLGDRHRLILIDTPGSSLRDTQIASRLGVLSNCASQMESALVLAGSTQAGAIEETVKRFAPANPACCVLTKLDEAASLGGALSALIRARLPVAYVSEGQRVPEDLRPARALELVSTAVRLAKTSGAAADEDLLRRRFGKTAHAIT